MKKNFDKPSFYITLPICVIALILIVVLFLLPDMSSKTVTTIPEYPPELGTIDENQALIAETLVIDRTNAKSIIEALKRPSEYFSETESVVAHTGGSATFHRKKWVKDNLSRVDIMTDSDRASTHYIYTKENIYIFSSSSRTYYKTSRGDFEPDDVQMLVSYEDILTTPDASVRDAKLVTLDGNSCIWVETVNAETGNVTRYWVATSTGLLLYAESIDKNEKTIYTFTTKNTEITEQSVDTFKLPDGSDPT